MREGGVAMLEGPAVWHYYTGKGGAGFTTSGKLDPSGLAGSMEVVIVPQPLCR